jgi:hypothetical protein
VHEHRAVPRPSTLNDRAVKKMVSEDNTPAVPAQDKSAGPPTSIYEWHADPEHRFQVTINGAPFDPSSGWRQKRERRRPPVRTPDGYLTRAEAGAYLGMSPRWMEQNDHAIRRINVAGPSTKKPAWRYLKADLDTFMASRSRSAKRGGGD